MEIRKELHASTALPSGFTAGNQLTGDWVCWSERDGEKRNVRLAEFEPRPRSQYTVSCFIGNGGYKC